MNRNRQRGFTMLDVVTGLLVTAILGAVAVPGVNDLVETYRLRSAANQIGFEVSRARLQAASEGRSVCVFVGGGQVERRVGTVVQPDCAENDPAEVIRLSPRISTSNSEVRFDGNGVATDREPISVQTGMGELLLVTDVLGRVTIS